MKSIIRFLMTVAMLFFTGVLVGQETPPRLIREIPSRVSGFSTNLTGELYIIDADNTLKKYNSNGDSVGVFNDVKQFGKLTYVRADNPWRVLLFYKSYQTIVLLDKYLETRGSITLRSLGINNVEAVSPSYDNEIWLFDRNEYKIKKVDESGNILLASVDFRQLFDVAPNPVRIKDSDGFLYLYDPERGMYIFDYYATLQNYLPFKNWKWFEIVKKDLIGFDDQNIYQYRSPLPDVSESSLPDFLKNADQIEFTLDKIYVLKKGRLSVYKR